MAIFKFCPSALENHFHGGNTADGRGYGNFDLVKIAP